MAWLASVLAAVCATSCVAACAGPVSLVLDRQSDRKRRSLSLPRISLRIRSLPVVRIVGLRPERRRRRRIDAEVPQLLDLLAAASSAGLSAPLALRRASDALQGPLGEELRASLDRIELGERWRDELRALSGRLSLPDVRRAVTAITRTETLGASLATSTTELAATVRQARRAAMTERARTAPVKMLFPLVFLVLPAFLLLTVAERAQNDPAGSWNAAASMTSSGSS